MLRITESCLADGGVRLQVEGELAGADLAELSRIAHSALREGPLVLDLREVSHASAPARALLRSLRDRGVQLVDCPLAIAGMLDL